MEELTQICHGAWYKFYQLMCVKCPTWEEISDRSKELELGLVWFLKSHNHDTARAAYDDFNQNILSGAIPFDKLSVAAWYKFNIFRNTVNLTKVNKSQT